MPSNETLNLMLQCKLEFLGTVANVCMLWWVSSIVFCGSVLSTVWLKRNEVKKVPAMDWLFIILLALFLSIVAFGAWVIYSTDRLQHEATKILIQLGIKTGYFYEFTGIKVTVAIGMTTFALVAITWIMMWFFLRKMRAEYLTERG